MVEQLPFKQLMGVRSPLPLLIIPETIKFRVFLFINFIVCLSTKRIRKILIIPLKNGKIIDD